MDVANLLEHCSLAQVAALDLGFCPYWTQLDMFYKKFLVRTYNLQHLQ